MEELLPETQEVHVAVGRIKSPDPGIDTMGELNDLLDSGERTEIRELLSFIGRYWKGRVVVEVEADAYGKILTPTEFGRLNKRLVSEIGTLMD